MIFSYVPDISVILPTFNRADHLQAAIESVIAQSLWNWELIVVDDGSTDNTFSVVNPYTARYENIRYMKHMNRKAAISRNAGIQSSFGRYITFLDSDDLYLPDHLETRYAMLESMPDVSLLTGGFACDENTWVRDRHDPEKLVHIRECILCGTLFGRRELFFALDGFMAMDYAEDTDLWDRASNLFTVLKIETPQTYVYLQSDDSITKQYRRSSS